MTVQEVFDTRANLELHRGYRQPQATGFNGRRIAMVATALGCGVLSVGGYWEYTAHRTHVVPVIEADARPMRVKPDNPGGMQIAGAGESILSGPEQIPQSLAPPPEMPDPGSLRLQEHGQSARDTLAQAATSAMPALTAQDMSAAPSPPPAHAAQPAPPATTQIAAAAAPRVAPPVTPPSAGGKLVQLASFGSEGAANAEWARLSRLMPDLLSHRRPDISQMERDGKTVWRLRTGGFADAAAASNFCNQVRAKGAACTAPGS